MQLNLQGQNPAEITGVSDERSIEIATVIDEFVSSQDGEVNINQLTAFIAQTCKTDEELALGLIGMGRMIGILEVKNSILGRLL